MTDATNSLGERFSRLMTHCADRAEKGFIAFLASGKEVVRLDVSHIKYSKLPEEQLKCRSGFIKHSLVIAAIVIAIIIAVSVIPSSGNGAMGYSIIGMASLVALTHLKEAFIQHSARKKE